MIVDEQYWLFCTNAQCPVVAFVNNSVTMGACVFCGLAGNYRNEIETAPEGSTEETEERVNTVRRCRFREEHGCSRVLCEFTGGPESDRYNYCEEA